MKHCYDYPRPALTVDVVLFALSDEGVELLLIERGHPPYEGCWALPGGFVDMDEPVAFAAIRELEEETGLTGIPVKQFEVFSAPDRDPRGRVVAVAHYAVVEKANCKPVAGDDARNVQWANINKLPELAFDHHEIIAAAKAAVLVQLQLLGKEPVLEPTTLKALLNTA